MTRPNKSTSKAGGKSSARKSKSATQATLPGKTLKHNQLDEISAGKPLAEGEPRKPWPPCETDA
jgi:hypothetical protein